MKRGARLKLIGLGAVAATTIVLSILALVALNAGGEARVGPAALLRVAAGYERRAQPLLSGPDAPSPEAARAAIDLSNRAIVQYPYDTAAWLQLAYVDATQHGGRLSPQGMAYLQRSYDLVAVDPDIGLWRIRFALETWPWLTFELHTAVAAEATALAATPRRQALADLRANIQDPVGRLTLGLWLNRLDAKPGR